MEELEIRLADWYRTSYSWELLRDMKVCVDHDRFNTDNDGVLSYTAFGWLYSRTLDAFGFINTYTDYNVLLPSWAVHRHLSGFNVFDRLFTDIPELLVMERLKKWRL
jgi:hypothetical protein